MTLPAIKAGFVGFGEVNSPRDLIERKCRMAEEALRGLGVDLVSTAPLSDDPDGRDVLRAKADLASGDFDLLVVCLAGWIPSHAVIDTISVFAHKPMVLWGLTGEYVSGRLVTTADQAGTTALRDVMDALGFRFRYVYDTPDAPYAAAARVLAYGEVVRAAAMLRGARIGTVGYRDMKLHATLADGVSLRRVIGPEIEPVELFEIAQRMPAQDGDEVRKVADQLAREWQSDRPLTLAVLEPAIRLYRSNLAL